MTGQQQDNREDSAMGAEQDSGQAGRGQRTDFLSDLDEAMRRKPRTEDSTYGGRTVSSELSWHNRARQDRDNRIAGQRTEDSTYRVRVFLSVVLVSVGWSVLGMFISMV